MITRASVKAFHEELDEVLKAFAEKHGMVFKQASVRFTDKEISGRMSFVVASEQENVTNAKAERYARRYSYAIHVGQPVHFQGKEYTVLDITSRGSVKIKDEAGKVWRVRPGQARSLMGAY